MLDQPGTCPQGPSFPHKALFKAPDSPGCLLGLFLLPQGPHLGPYPFPIPRPPSPSAPQHPLHLRGAPSQPPPLGFISMQTQAAQTQEDCSSCVLGVGGWEQAAHTPWQAQATGGPALPRPVSPDWLRPPFLLITARLQPVSPLLMAQTPWGKRSRLHRGPLGLPSSASRLPCSLTHKPHPVWASGSSLVRPFQLGQAGPPFLMGEPTQKSQSIVQIPTPLACLGSPETPRNSKNRSWGS